jgi:hypothetical protein
VTSSEPVPEADRLEQEMPTVADRRDAHSPSDDAPEADAYEQELPLVDPPSPGGTDAERSEPVSDDEWATPTGT